MSGSVEELAVPNDFDEEDDEAPHGDHDETSGISVAERVDFDASLVDDDPDNDYDVFPPTDQPEEFEPSFDLANGLLFYDVARRLEQVANAWRLRVSAGDGPSKAELLTYLLPPQLLKRFRAPPLDRDGQPQEQPQSIYPLLRLLVPRRDGHRPNYNVKESKLANAYIQAFDLQSRNEDMLRNWEDPTKCTVEDGVGDFSRVVQTVLENRLGKNEDFGGHFQKHQEDGFTIGFVNALLDELAGLQNKARDINDRMMAQGADVRTSRTSQQKLLVHWIKKLNPFADGSKPSRVWGLSPREHKWLCRIILGTFRIGIGDVSIMQWYNTSSTSLWDAHNSLKAVCSKLVSPGYAMAFQRPLEVDGVSNTGLQSYMTLPAQPITFGVPFVPMCAAKTTFGKTLELISAPHRRFDDSSDERLPFKRALALRNPAFTIETKLDGERQVVHFRRDGVVQIQSRRSNWFSDLYSPVLGPPLRQALGKHGFDIVLDGEILAYCGEKDGNQFGLNRMVAKKRREWLESLDLIDDRDKNIHAHDNEYKSMNLSSAPMNVAPKLAATELDDSVSGENVWLTFVAFDVLYVDGPGAQEFLDNTISTCLSPRPPCGSLIALSAMERKKILYRLIDVQPNFVEIVDTKVVRPTGVLVEGRDYFSYENPFTDEDTGHPAFTVDSLDCVFSNVTDPVKVESNRVEEQFSQSRAISCDRIYKKTVDEFCLEGVTFKDLGSAYLLGEPSRALRYWQKLKPDYSDNSPVSDLDLVIIGGFFASGLAKAGAPSSFLLACRDSMNPGQYMPLCRINAGVQGDVYKSFYQRTGCGEYRGAAQEEGTCKWFCSKDQLPDFISKRSFQRSWAHADHEGWKWDKANYPSIWIRPENSAIVTVKAGEIISANSFPPGVTLRHPRISDFRNEGIGDEKDLSAIECENQLRDLYRDYMESRSKTFNSNILSTNDALGVSSNQTCLFLTESQAAKTRKAPIKRPRKLLRHLDVATGLVLKSRALEGVSFYVLPGTYALCESEIDRDLARSEGWFDEAERVREKKDVESYILSHGGEVQQNPDSRTMVLGGRRDDWKVKSHVQGINRAIIAVKNNKQTVKRPKPTAKDIQVQLRAKEQGVIRWGFVYSVVCRWMHLFPNLGPDMTVLDTRPELLQPHILDYLARPQEPGHNELAELCLLDLGDEDVIQLRRALQSIESIDADNELIRPWQLEAMDQLKESECRVLRLNQVGYDCGKIVFYPDVFPYECFDTLSKATDLITTWTPSTDDCSHCLKPGSGRIMATLPLARVMGAMVSSRLSHHVTHVICDLIGEADTEYSAKQLITSTGNGVCRALLDKIISLEESQGVSIKLVAPGWIRKRKRDWMA